MSTEDLLGRLREIVGAISPGRLEARERDRAFECDDLFAVQPDGERVGIGSVSTPGTARGLALLRNLAEPLLALAEAVATTPHGPIPPRDCLLCQRLHALVDAAEAELRA